jgi:F-type H+-transporting ATPase subunit b
MLIPQSKTTTSRASGACASLHKGVIWHLLLALLVALWFPTALEAASPEHGEGIAPLIARLLNFGILVGLLVYLLRSPIGGYLTTRSGQIRDDLVHAAETKEAAAAQIAELDRRMAALPGELAALRERGVQEIAAEEQRIRQAAEAERERLLEQMRREMDVRLRLAQRDLMQHAAALAISVGMERIRRNITADDQLRLVDRYLDQVYADSRQSNAVGVRTPVTGNRMLGAC